MIERSAGNVKKAYDHLANQYDTLMSSSRIFRNELWKLYGKTFVSGQHIVDLGCGTGIDTLFLAEMGCRVTAIDLSQKMLDQLEKKISGHRGQLNITIVQYDIENFSRLALSDIDGVVSGFAAINTVCELRGLSEALHSALSENGKVILHGLNTWKSPRSDEENGEIKIQDIKIGDVEVPHFIRPADALYENYFKNDFDLIDRFGTGRYYPIYESVNCPLWLKKMVKKVEEIVTNHDELLTKGRFFVMVMKKREV